MIGTELRILVVGAGIAGLAAARTLRLAGFHPHVVERQPATTIPGAGIFLPGNAARALCALGLHKPVRKLGAVVERQLVLTPAGDVIADVDTARLWAGVGECRALPRADLHRVLLTGAGGAVRHDTEVRGLEIADGSAKVDFADGTRAEYDLVIAADGRRSTVRALAGLGGPARSVGQRAYRAVVGGVPGVDAWTALVGGRRSFLAMPIGSGRVYCYADEPLAPAAPAAAPAADPAARLRELFGAYGGPVPALLDRICADGVPVQVAALEEVELPRWSRGPVLLLGDAAHATSPAMAQGAAMALEDALVLADELRRCATLADGLAAYEARRRPRTSVVLRETRRRDRARVLPAGLGPLVLRHRAPTLYGANHRPLADPL